jgi:hypothetical protein
MTDNPTPTAGELRAAVDVLLRAWAPTASPATLSEDEDMYTNGDIWHTEELYAEIEAANAAKAAEVAK